MRMLAGFVNGILYAVGALKDEGAPAAAHATALAAAGTTADGPPILRRCWRMDKAGRISDLKLVEEPIGAPAPGHIRVAVKAIGLNLADVFAIIGLYSATPKGSFVPGLEYAGVVESVGGGKAAAANGLRPGDKVFGFTRFGAYASHVVVPELYCRKLPPGWTFEQGASFVVQGLTAWHGLVELGGCKPGAGQTVLVHSAAGGVGALALELCEKLKAFPIATIGSEAKVKFLQERFGLKREQIIVRETNAKGFAAQLQTALEASGREGYDIILDALGGIYFKEGFKQLSRGGRMVTFGAADYLSASNGANWLKIIPRYLSRPTIDPGDLCSENRGVLGFNLIWLTDKVTELNEELDDMLRYPWNPPHVGSTYRLEQLPEAVRALQSGATVGKVVVCVDDGGFEAGVQG